MFALKYAAFVVLAAAAVNADTEVPQIMTGTHTCMDHACMHGKSAPPARCGARRRELALGSSLLHLCVPRRRFHAPADDANIIARVPRSKDFTSVTAPLCACVHQPAQRARVHPCLGCLKRGTIGGSTNWPAAGSLTHPNPHAHVCAQCPPQLGPIRQPVRRQAAS